MIYSTLCVGKNWVNKHKDSVEKISKDNYREIITFIYHLIRNFN